MANCKANHDDPTCIPGTEECYYIIAMSLCDGDCENFLAVGSGMSVDVEPVPGSNIQAIEATLRTENYFIKMSEGALRKAGVRPLALAPGVSLPKANVDCRFAEETGQPPS